MVLPGRDLVNTTLKEMAHLPIIVAWIVGFIVSGSTWIGAWIGVVLEIVVRAYAVPDIG